VGTSKDGVATELHIALGKTYKEFSSLLRCGVSQALQLRPPESWRSI